MIPRARDRKYWPFPTSQNSLVAPTNAHKKRPWKGPCGQDVLATIARAWVAFCYFAFSKILVFYLMLIFILTLNPSRRNNIFERSNIF